MTSLFCDRFEKISTDHRAQVAIYAPSAGRVVTFGDLWNEYAGMKRVFTDARLPERASVVALAGNRPAFVSTLLACLDTSRVLIPLDPDTTVVEAMAIVHELQAEALIAPPETPIEAVHQAFPLPGGLVLWKLSGPHATCDLRDAAVLKLTSGSTGLPKAVITSEANLWHDASHIIEGMGIGPQDVNLAAISLAHSYGLGNLVLPLLVQGTRIVVRNGFAPARLFGDIRECGVTIFAGVPFMFEHLRKHGRVASLPEPLRLLITAGARIEPATVRFFKEHIGRKIHSFYGTTETGGIAYDAGEAVSEPLAVGRPLPHVTLTLKKTRDHAGPGGRLHVISPAVGSGYVQTSGDIDQSAFCDGGYLTGDLAYVDETERLFLSGRVSAFINVAGRKVHPEEIERVLLEVPGISAAKVFGIPCETRGQTLVACVISNEAAVGPMALRRHCSRKLSPFKVPRHFVLMDGFPVDARGKTDRRALEALVTRSMPATTR